MKTAYCNELKRNVDIAYLKRIQYNNDKNYTFMCPNVGCELKHTLCAWDSKNKSPYFCRSNYMVEHTCQYDEDSQIIVDYEKKGKKRKVKLYDLSFVEMTQEDFQSLRINVNEKPIIPEEQNLEHGLKATPKILHGFSTIEKGSKAIKKVTFNKICNLINGQEDDCLFCVKLTKQNLNNFDKNSMDKYVFFGKISTITRYVLSEETAFVNISIEDGFSFSIHILGNFKSEEIKKNIAIDKYLTFKRNNKFYIYYDGTYSVYLEERISRYKAGSEIKRAYICTLPNKITEL